MVTHLPFWPWVYRVLKLQVAWLNFLFSIMMQLHLIVCFLLQCVHNVLNVDFHVVKYKSIVHELQKEVRHV